MSVVVMMMVVAVTEFVAGACAILNQMHEVLIAEKGERAEDVRLVDGANGSFKFDERHRSHGRGERLGDDDAVGGGPDAMLGKEERIVHVFTVF